ncbi:hypothetical protein N9B82_01390 [Saprospiraceae bacterium]|nr:hypothetical protein [Saprospiraceae bacterium]
MRILLQILCLCWLFPPLITGQFSDNFSDGDLTDNPTWQGDAANFKVNDIGQLQLDAAEAGASILYIPISVQADFVWEFDLSLNFAPSDNNNGKVYFLIDNTDLTMASGYYVEIGENLAEDRLKFFRLDNGIPVLLAEAETGAMATKPADVSLKVERVEGLWTISTDYEKQGFPVEELNFFDDIYEFQTDGFFLIETKYTSSNADEIFFDNLVGEIFVPDTEGPKLIDYENIGQTQIVFSFDEAILVSSLNDIVISSDPTNTVQEVEIFGSVGNEILVTFTDPFISGPEYTVTVENLRDENSNLMEVGSISFVLPVSPSVGDLVINEILFDPMTGGVDFIEIINISDKILELDGLILANKDKDDNEKNIEGSFILKPMGIIAITKDTLELKADYSPIPSAKLAELAIPTLNADEGNVSLLLPDQTVIDSFDYNEDHHLALLDETKGVSLERIFPSSPTSPENFTSGVKSTNYATPGYQNANFREDIGIKEEVLTLESDVFSPNADGDMDQLIMFIDLPDVGYLSTIRIFNINGQLIKILQNNQITGKEDVARWDGLMEDGGNAAIGHYVVHFQAFKTSGETIEIRKHIKLLDFL